MGKLHLSRKCHHILHWNLVAPSLQSRISMQAANPCFTQMNILLPSFNSDSVRTETMDSAVEPNFLVAYSSVSLSTHIRMLLELSSFANEFFKQVFFSPSLSCWTGSCTGAGQSKTGRRALALFWSWYFSEIKSTLLRNKRKRWFLDVYFIEAILKLEHSKPITCNSVCDVDLTGIWKHNPLILFWLLGKLVINCSLGNQNRTKNA